MMVSFGIIFAMVIGVLLTLVGVTWILMLVANRKTRPWALGFLGLLALATLVLMLGTRFWSFRASPAPLEGVAYVHSSPMGQMAGPGHMSSMHGRAASPSPAEPRTEREYEADKERIERELRTEWENSRAKQARADRVGTLVLAPIVTVVGLGLLAGLVYLLINPRTRSVLLGLVGAMAAFALLLVVGYARTGGSMPAKTPPADHASTTRVSADSAIQLGDSSGAAASAAESSGSDATGLWEAVGTALGKAIAAARKAAGQETAPPAPAASPTPAAIELSAERPDWVDRDADRTEKGDFQMPIYVGPYATREECQSELPAKLLSAVGEYAAGRIGPQARGKVRLPLDYIQNHIVKSAWEEWKEFEPPLGKMVKLHVLLHFDRQANARIDQAWNRVIVNRRLGAVAAAGLLLLAFLSTAWAYLKIDLATGGSRRRMLRVGAAAVALALVAFGAALCR